MLRLPKFEVKNPATAEEAVAMMFEVEGDARFIAGGTDLNPNMKHGLFAPERVVALSGIAELQGISRAEDGSMRIGAMTTLTQVTTHAELRRSYPSLCQAAKLVSGPQLRNMGTIGGNVMLDTRCQWYNQTYFWRKALGYCMKKDGEKCHVVEGGSKCVAAASNDTAPALMTLSAELEFVTAEGRTRMPIADLWQADGIWNKKLPHTALLVAIHLPAPAADSRSAYGKLRDRGSVDFPLFGIAARLDIGSDGVIEDASLCAVALQARPWPLKKATALLVGTRPGESCFRDAVEMVASLAAKQCRPMPNIPGDHEYRHLMVPVFTRRTLYAAADDKGPVHHV
ncbi:MAG: FAD binding domain-containing protein [Planctomycetota bacterium]|jgi:4-hydroxybenzoyl-CoA reductase subunit beta|nr:FAD binding domain-containing protein [Planctomycetota bacterium]